MPNEPEREIEKTLRAYAAKRRADAGAPRELHPATRRLLQGEAARVHAPARSAGSWSQRLRVSWPQWAVGFGAVAVLAATVSLLVLNGTKEKRASVNLAYAPMSAASADRNVPARDESKPVAQLAPAPENKSSPNVKLTPDAEKTSAEKRPIAGAGKNQVAQATPPSPQLAEPTERAARSADDVANRQPGTLASSSVALDKKLEAENLGSKLDATRIPAASTPAPAASPPAPAVPAFAGTTASVSGGEVGAGSLRKVAAANIATQKFTRLPQTETLHLSLKNSAASTVLASFRVEMTGDQIRIVDADGSVYAGRLEQKPVAAPGFREDQSRQRLFAPAHGTPQPAAPATDFSVNGSVAPPSPTTNYFFRVTGTNLTLKKALVFTGNFAGTPAPPVAPAAVVSPSPSSSFDAVDGTAKPVDGRPLPLRLTNLLITGRAVIGTNSMDISAKAEQPRRGPQ